MNDNKKRIVRFLIYYFFISVGVLLFFFFWFTKLFWFSLVTWLFATFGVISISFFTFMNLRITELENESKDVNNKNNEND
ncbi:MULTISPECIES: hypothetical protein [Petrotoga]|uniref:Uncharacterized protein n=1 Tax=Petrotoga sibirica DSM 13575 TaxID=1122956 RepID=A0A855MM08_9BACT|nr:MULTISPECIES: hypothetical protein [Petrotoga]POZ87998.1 hypothetical protein AA80_07890 [Petrotoga sibirica DSM 13575]POZ90088.1 hypothetical protein AD60_08020 [Petrotoga sp. SL27]